MVSPRHNLTLCASLVQNPMNLGALCRTAEVFRLQALVLPSLAIGQDSIFRKVAVSADQWQPMVACAPGDLPTWLRAQQAAGISVLALTQHPTAIPLPQVTFPPQVVLVLGRELTGIPEDIVAQCEGAIAVPQWGQVESLNVHTAAAIATYAYLCQHAKEFSDPRTPPHAET